MFRRRSEDELWKLQQELIAAEEEDEEYEEEYEEYDEEEYDGEYDEAYEEEPDEDAEEEEPVCPERLSRYRRGNPKKFTDRGFFDEDEFADEDVLYRKDYKKAKRRKRRQRFGMILLAVAELFVIGALILWFMSWM